MPVHYFRIMNEAPVKGQDYSFEPEEREKCVAVHDDNILPLLTRLKEVKCCWHSLDREENGLAYYGITLIPPRSCEQIIEIIQDCDRLEELLRILRDELLSEFPASFDR